MKRFNVKNKNKYRRNKYIYIYLIIKKGTNITQNFRTRVIRNCRYVTIFYQTKGENMSDAPESKEFVEINGIQDVISDPRCCRGENVQWYR